MAITYGGVSSSGLKTGAGSADYSWNHTVQPGSNLLVVCVMANRSSGYTFVDEVYWNGDLMTEVAGAQIGGTETSTILWYMLNPTTGTHAVRCVDATQANNVTAVAMDFGGVASFDVADEQTGATDPALTVDVTGSSSLIVVGACSASNDAKTPSANLTETNDSAQTNSPDGRALAGYCLTTSPQEALSWNGTNAEYTIAALSFKAMAKPKVIMFN